MRCPALLAELIYRATRPAACVASPLLPQGMHSGKRVHRVLATCRMPDVDAQFARALLESEWTSALLLRHVSQLEGASLAAFIERRVDYDGATTLTELTSEPRPLIFATPHYGVPLVGAVAASHAMRGRRTLNLFYDKERYGERLAPFFKRAGMETSALLGGLAGVRAALRALESGECLALRPDTFDDINQTVVVPFFGRLLRVASGTAFLALRSRALIVPTFTTPRRDLGVRITLSEPIDPSRLVADDDAQALFTLTHLLFLRIEEQLRRAPQHWRYWEALPQVSTPCGTFAQPGSAELLETLKTRFHALPPDVQDIPELELLLE